MWNCLKLFETVWNCQFFFFASEAFKSKVQTFSQSLIWNNWPIFFFNLFFDGLGPFEHFGAVLFVFVEQSSALLNGKFLCYETLRSWNGTHHLLEFLKIYKNLASYSKECLTNGANIYNLIFDTFHPYTIVIWIKRY